MTDQSGDVERKGLPAERPKELPDVQRRAAAVANHDRRHAHADEVFRARHVGHFVGVGVDVNETGRDNEALGVNFRFSLVGEAADGGDAAVFHCHVRHESRCAGAVHDSAVTNDQVVGLRINGR